MPFLSLMQYFFALGDGTFWYWYSFFSTNFFGMSHVNCPAKMIITTKRWFKLFMWLPAWISVAFVYPIRFFYMVAYFPIVLFYFILAHISNFMISIVDAMSFFWASYYTFYPMMLMVTIVMTPFLMVLAAIWFFTLVLQYFLYIIQYFHNLFFMVFWTMYHWFWTVFWYWGPYQFFWIWWAWWRLLFDPLDDLCWSWFDIWDDMAVSMLDNFEFPYW